MRADHFTRLVLVLGVVAGPAATVAGTSKHHKHEPVAASVVDVRTPLAQQLAEQSSAVGHAESTVRDKLDTLDATRLRRLRAAARLLHEPLPSDASADDQMAFARRRAATQLLAKRDAHERMLLANELAQLHDADTRITDETAQLATLAVPGPLLAPARGTVIRAFGPYEHEATHAILSRRGIDLDVEDGTEVVAPADGVVRYSGPIRGLDRGVIIDHGGFFSVIAKLADSLPPAGTRVARGDRVGRAAHHRVYLEIRGKLGPGGLPIDPQPLLARP